MSHVYFTKYHKFCCGTTKHRVSLFSFYCLYILAFLSRNATYLIIHDRGFRTCLCLMQSNDWSIWFSGGKRNKLFYENCSGKCIHLEHISLVLGWPYSAAITDCWETGHWNDSLFLLLGGFWLQTASCKYNFIVLRCLLKITIFFCFERFCHLKSFNAKDD